MTGVVLLGQGFMGRVHSTALRLLPALPGNVAPEPVGICGRDRDALAEAQRRFGWAHATTDWRALLELPGAELLIVATPNGLHAEPAIAALGRGMHVLCEKPLAPTAAEAQRMWHAAGDRVAACGFNYRCLPALRAAREIVAAGELGEPLAFRSRFLMARPARDWRLAGGDALRDLAVHHLDLARWLVGEPAAVTAVARGTDAVAAALRFANGATGTVEAARGAGGHLLHSAVEVDGSRGTVAFDLRRLNELRRREGATTTTLTVASPLWWPAGHPLGWFESFVHQLRHVLEAIALGRDVAPAATFADGHRCAVVCDAIARSLRSGSLEVVPAP